MALYVNIPIPDTPKEFLLNAFNYQHNTIDQEIEVCSDDEFHEYYFATTYFDKECTEIECLSRRRSFYDLLEVVQTYYPLTTESDLGLILCDLILYDNLSLLFCGDIDKFVFFKNECDTPTEYYEIRDNFLSGYYKNREYFSDYMSADKLQNLLGFHGSYVANNN